MTTQGTSVQIKWHIHWLNPVEFLLANPIRAENLSGNTTTVHDLTDFKRRGLPKVNSTNAVPTSHAHTPWLARSPTPHAQARALQPPMNRYLRR